MRLTTDDADEIAPQHRLDARYPFTTDGKDSVLGLTLTTLTRDELDVHESHWTFYALRSTFLAAPNDDDAVVPWEQWGRGEARVRWPLFVDSDSIDDFDVILTGVVRRWVKSPQTYADTTVRPTREHRQKSFTRSKLFLERRNLAYAVFTSGSGAMYTRSVI